MKPIDKDAILDAFAAESIHDRNILVRYVREFPELAEELIDLASELRLSAELAEEQVCIISDPKLKSSWEYFLAAAPKPAASATAVGLFAPLKGAAFAALAMKLDIPRSILMAVRDRLVVPSSVPGGFLRRFADATSTTVELTKAHIAQSCQLPLSLAFKSDQKPSQQGQATFRQLVENTEMSESQRFLLLRECAEHELT